MACLLFDFTDFISRALQVYKSDNLISTPILILGNAECQNERTNDCGPLVFFLVSRFISLYVTLPAEEIKNFTDYKKEDIANTSALFTRNHFKQEFET